MSKPSSVANKPNSEFFEALALLEKEKGIPEAYMLERIRAAIVLAVKRDYGGKDGNIEVVMEPKTQEFSVGVRKTVTEEVTDKDEQITLQQAQQYNPGALPGSEVLIPLETRDFGRIAAQTAKHVIRQGIREAERGQQMEEFQRRNQELVTARVIQVDPVTGAATLEIGQSEAVLAKNEQMETDHLQEGDQIKVYVVDVREGDRGPRMLISRTHPGLVRRLFENEVPEIYSGTVEIKSVSREAGSRSKIAVWAKEENVDPVGACIGPHGSRVSDIVDELGGEKIDVIPFSENPVEFISAALSPAKVLSVEVDPQGAKSCKATVPDNQLSLAIGNKGQNVRLAVRLTGWKIDIRPESGFYGEDTPSEV